MYLFFSYFQLYHKCAIIDEDGSVAQLVEQRPEEPCVTGSSPVGTTKPKLAGSGTS